MGKVYFPNLNGLRFIAALMVVVHHIEQLKSIFGMDNLYKYPPIFFVGKLGVVLFFVLSGFLITYLLLREKESTNTISVKQFYIRRILRIWPLYYFIVILGLVILPMIPWMNVAGLSESIGENLPVKILLFVLFLPNVALTLFPAIPFISQTWSVGVEEQFYLLWPLLIKKFNNTFKVLIAVIVFYFVIRVGLLIFLKMDPNNYWIGRLSSFWSTFSIDCMAIGGLAAALLFYKKEKWLSLLFNNYLQLSVYALLLVLILSGFHAPALIHYEFYAFFFAIMILNLAANKASVISLENPILNYLGKISYGLYMYHVIAIVIVLKCVTPYTGNSILIYAGSILLTIAMAATSYKYLEARFIKAKKKFTIVESGDSAKQ